MNKGFKNYTKRITQAVGNVAEVSVNVNKTDSNIHVTMPLVSTIGKCPIATSLIFDFQSRGSTFGFGKGARLNYYSLVAGINGGFQITNSDGSSDKYLSEKNYFNVESGLTLKKEYDDAYDLTYHYEAEDTQENYMEFASSGNYPRLIKKANGDKITLDFTSNVKKISNAYGDVVKFNSGSRISNVEYCHNDEILARAEISYDTNNYIKEITYFNNNGVVVKKLSLSITDNQIVVKDAISGYRIQYTISGGVVTSIKDGYDDSFTRGNEITIAAVDGRTTITDEQTGKVSYIIFDSDNYPLYEVDDSGSVVEYAFDKDTNQMKFQSHPMHTKDVNENIAYGVAPTLSNVTVTEVSVTDELGKKLVGTKAKKYTANGGSGTITYKISENGIATDNVTAMVFGRFVDGTYKDTPAYAVLRLMPSVGQIAKGESGASVSNIESGDFDAAVIGVTAGSSYSYIQLVITIPEGASVEIGGVRIFKQECGAFYEYDEQGNITEAVSGNKSKEATYDAGKATQTIGVDSALVNHEYNDKKQLTKSTHAYGATVEYEYDGIHPNNVVKTTVRSGNGDVTLETSRTYTEDGRFVKTETDVNGMTRTYEYSDKCGNISQVKDAMSIVTNYKHLPNGLLEELKLDSGTSSTNVKYAYDNKNRISTIELTNGSKYAFEYDCFDNISTIKLNSVVVFRYEYDNNNRLVKQHYGESSDCYEFTYTESGLIDRIYYINKGVKTLKYTYNYDIINRMSEVTDSNNKLLCRYEYDADGRVSKVVGADSTVEVGYDNLGNVNTKKATVSGKTISQSFDTVNRSKGSHPGTLHKSEVVSYDGVFFGMFDKDAKIYNYNNEFIAPVGYNENEDVVSTDECIPCYRINSTKTLSYKLEMKSPYNDECGFIAFCFKPKALKKQYLFSVKNPERYGGLYACMNKDGYVCVYAINSKGEEKSIITCKNMVQEKKWNYFALSFMNRNDGLGYSDIGEYLINLNGCTEKFVCKNPRIYYELGLNPVYNIGHNYDGTTATDHFEGSITCLTVSPRDYVGDNYINKHYRTMKDYVIENALISDEDSIATVDFSDTNLYTTNSSILNKFEIYPLHNSVESLDGSRPMGFEHRCVSKNDKDRNFNFNSKIKRYAYVADGFDLRYYFGSANSGTVMMRAYIDTLANRQYFFDMKDLSGKTLGLFRNDSRTVCIDYNGEIIPTNISLGDNMWHTVGLSFDKDVVSDSAATVTYMDFRVYVDGNTYQVTRSVDYEYGILEFSVGKSYTSDATNKLQETRDNFGPLRGQIEMLAISSAFCEKATLDTLTSELKTYTKVCEFDDLGMLRKTEIHCAGTPILSNVITYKKNGENTTMYVANEKFTHNGSTRTRTYTTDLYGRVTAVSDTVLGNHTYEYDYRGFLSREDDRNFEYDGNGNIIRSGDTVFTYDNVIKDRLMSVGGKPITYSESNPLNPQTYDGKTFEFEGRRLVKVTSDNMVATYKYDDTGLRTEKTVTENGVTTTTKFVYDSGKLIAEYTGTGRVDYLYDENGMLYGFIYDNAKYFYIRDTFKNILSIVDANGIPVTDYEYSFSKGYSVILDNSLINLANINKMRFVGCYYDNETGYYYTNFSYYSFEWRRYLQIRDANVLKKYTINGLNVFSDNKFVETYSVNTITPKSSLNRARNIDHDSARSLGAESESENTFSIHGKIKWFDTDWPDVFVFTSEKIALVDWDLSVVKASLYFDEKEEYSVYVSSGNASAFAGYDASKKKVGVFADVNVLSAGYDGKYLDAGVSLVGVGFIVGMENWKFSAKVDPPGFFGFEISIDFGKLYTDLFVIHAEQLI